MSLEKFAKDLTSILDELTAENLDDLTEDELLEYRKQLNTYGRTIEGSDNYLTFSHTNLSEKYTEKLQMTAMIGYLNSELDKYLVPHGHRIIPVYDYCHDPTLIDEYSKDWSKTDKIQKELDQNKEAMQKRIIIKEFLETVFQYNPDVHVRSSYKPQPKDIVRSVIDTPAANLAISQLKKGDAKFRELMLEYDRIQKMIAMKENSSNVALDNIMASKLVLPDQHYATVNYGAMTSEDKNLLRTTCEMIPPTDTFFNYKSYFETNYDKLREAVQYLYCDKSDFEQAINPYSWHNTRAEAEEFQKKHKGEVISDIIIADSGKWNIFSPFAKVRDTMKYFNENTIVLETIAEQIEQDAKIGGELMKNRIKVEKKRNIAEDGPDAETFSKWKAANSTLKDMNAVTNNKDSFAPEETPDDAIAVPVYRISDGNFTKSTFFSKAFAPTTNEEKK
jgi:uncharacterized protein YdcH (DUF465 family)